MSDVTKPIVLDETLQATNVLLGQIKNAMSPIQAVLFAEQNLTDEQKAQARANIGAMANTPTGSNFAEMQAIVRAGNAPQQYPVGSIFTVSHTGIMSGLTIAYPFVVVAHDHYPDPDGVYEHSMTALSLYVPFDMQYDAPEAFYNTGESGLAAGDYKVTLGSTTYYFTVSQAIPANRQLFKQSNTLIYVYDPTQPTTYESTIAMSTTAIENATNLGTSGATSGEYAYKVNHNDRITNGSNNYAQCCVRQIINSNKPAYQWWSAKTPFDRPSSLSRNGFLYGMNPDFLEIVGKTTIGVKASPYEIGFIDDERTIPAVANTPYTVTDKFFLPSWCELGSSSSVIEGNPWTYYTSTYLDHSLSAADRIKYKIGARTTADTWRTRSINDTKTNSVYYVANDGSNIPYDSYTSAAYDYGIAVACTIR